MLPPPPPPPVPSGVDAQTGQILFGPGQPPSEGPAGAREPFPDVAGSPQASGPPMPARAYQGAPRGPRAMAAHMLGRPISPFMAGLLGGITGWAVLKLARWAWSRRR